MELEGMRRPLTSEKLHRLYPAVFLALLCIGAFLRLYRLGEVPLGLQFDEATISYNAYCLGFYGTDMHDNWMPLFPQNAYSGQAPFSLYGTAVLFRLLGRSVFTLRLLPALLGLVTLGFGMLLLKELLGEGPSLAGGLLMNMLPVFLMQSRIALDCNAMLPVMTVAVYGLLLAVRKGKKWRYALAGLVTGLVLYTYGLSFVVVPVYVLLAMGTLFYVKRIRPGEAAVFAAVLAVLAVPCILFAAVGFFGWDSIRTPLFTINAIQRASGSEIGLGHLVENIQLTLKSILFHDTLSFNAVSQYGTLYLLSAPFFVVGLVKACGETVRSLGERRYSPAVIVVIWFAAEFLLGLLIESVSGPAIHRLNGVFVPALCFVVSGMATCLRALRRPIARRAFCAAAAVCYLAFTGMFLRYYFTHFSHETSYGPESSALVYDEAYAYLREAGTDVDCYRDQVVTYYYGLHDTLPPWDYREDGTIAADSPVELRVHWFKTGLDEILPGHAAYIFRDYNSAAFDQMASSPYAGNYQEINYGRYTMFYCP